MPRHSSLIFLFATLFLFLPRAQAADLQGLHAKAAALITRSMPSGTSIAELSIDADEAEWPTDAESFAYELTDLGGKSTVHALKSWGSSASDESAAFVIGHEMAHALCGHRFKELGIYAAQTNAVGLDLALLAEGAGSDQAFAFSILSTQKEMEADAIGAAIARDMGLDWREGAVQAVGASEDSGSHAAGPQRIKDIQERLSRSGADLRSLGIQCRIREPASY